MNRSLRVLLPLAVLGSLAAQDITMSPVTWATPHDAPEELPVRRQTPAMEFPAELKATSDIGYVVYDVVLDPKGKILALGPHATLAAYERAARGYGGELTWTAGKRAGKGVNTATYFAVIFNPASAALRKADATPRLLDVSCVRVPQPEGAKPDQVIPERVELGEISVDATGAVTAIKQAPPGLERAFAIAVKNWRFAPARRDGQPVAADVRVPFVVVTSSVPSTGKSTVPRVITQPPPIYPREMRASGMRGEVLVDFLVDIEGRVRNAYVIRSLNPSFDDPAVEAVRQWQFEPGRVGERPVVTHMQVPVIFTIEETGGGGKGPLSETRRGDLSKLPEEFRYDSPPKPNGTVRAVYPYALLRAKKTGKASVVYVVGPKGTVVQTIIKQGGEPEFGRAVQAAAECFTFEPALKNSRPSPAMQLFTQEFDRDFGLQLVNDEDLALLRREEKKPETILTLSELDEEPKPRSRRPPQFPLSVAEDVTYGESLIEFLIDEEGRARLPRILKASEEAFGYAAVQAVATWRFEPPKRGGRTVVARVQIPIQFGEAAGKK